jgi:hypothetical protein
MFRVGIIDEVLRWNGVVGSALPGAAYTPM